MCSLWTRKRDCLSPPLPLSWSAALLPCLASSSAVLKETGNALSNRGVPSGGHSPKIQTTLYHASTYKLCTRLRAGYVLLVHDYPILRCGIQVCLQLQSMLYLRALLRPHASQCWGFHVPLTAKAMSRDRFLEVRRALHFTDNSKAPNKADSKHDRAWKLWPIVDHFYAAFQAALSPTAEQSIDERMVKFKGCNSMRHSAWKINQSSGDSNTGAAMIVPQDTCFNLTYT